MGPVWVSKDMAWCEHAHISERPNILVWPHKNSQVVAQIALGCSF
jgi:hypothetical protein